MRFYCEDKTLDIGAGDVVFLPHNKAHAFTCTSNVLQHVDFCTGHWQGCCRPGQLFPRDGEPAGSMVLPESAVTYAVDDPEHAIRVGASTGIRILSPSETQRALPQYPGLSMPVR